MWPFLLLMPYSVDSIVKWATPPAALLIEITRISFEGKGVKPSFDCVFLDQGRVCEEMCVLSNATIHVHKIPWKLEGVAALIGYFSGNKDYYRRA